MAVVEAVCSMQNNHCMWPINTFDPIHLLYLYTNIHKQLCCQVEEVVSEVAILAGN
jgi:hypothetical protein